MSHSHSTSTSTSAATSAATSASVSRVASLEHHEGEHAMSDLNKKNHFAKLKKRLKKRLSAVKKEWGPGLAAKEDWDDEYNFPGGRWAGQGLERRSLI
ncbi:hypothetical protein BDW75DRAFT_234070 [Aspergillus navahoensis]